MRELNLTSMNPEFLFKPDQKKQDVLTALEKHNDYWWVPVVETDRSRALKDVIHARVFWDPRIDMNSTLSDMISGVASGGMKDFAKLHGDGAFFVKVSLDDKISDVSDKMGAVGAVVGIVVDDKGRPTGCFTSQDLLNAQPAPSSSQ